VVLPLPLMGRTTELRNGPYAYKVKNNLQKPAKKPCESEDKSHNVAKIV
jgi:hypothetical protein